MKKLAFLSCLVLISFLGFSQQTTKKITISEVKDSDSLYETYSIYKQIIYHELVMPIEEYDPENKQPGCYFLINDKQISISQILPEVFYNVNWHLNPDAYYTIDSGKEYILVSITFYSGSDSTPPEYRLSINLKDQNVVKL